jgi:hypothetical protein
LGGKTTRSLRVFAAFGAKNAWKDVFHGAPRLGAPDLARLGRVQPRHALEPQLVVLRREAWTELSAERNDPGLSRRGEEKATREVAGQQHSDRRRITSRLGGDRSSVH